MPYLLYFFTPFDLFYVVFSNSPSFYMCLSMLFGITFGFLVYHGFSYTFNKWNGIKYENKKFITIRKFKWVILIAAAWIIGPGNFLILGTIAIIAWFLKIFLVDSIFDEAKWFKNNPSFKHTISYIVSLILFITAFIAIFWDRLFYSIFLELI